MKLDITSRDVHVGTRGMIDPVCDACGEKLDEWGDNAHSLHECIKHLRRLIAALQRPEPGEERP